MADFVRYYRNKKLICQYKLFGNASSIRIKAWYTKLFSQNWFIIEIWRVSGNIIIYNFLYRK